MHMRSNAFEIKGEFRHVRNTYTNTHTSKLKEKFCKKRTRTLAFTFVFWEHHAPFFPALPLISTWR